MKPTKYSVKTSLEEFNVTRVVEENPKANFIRVEDRKTRTALVLVRQSWLQSEFTQLPSDLSLIDGTGFYHAVEDTSEGFFLVCAAYKKLYREQNKRWFDVRVLG